RTWVSSAQTISGLQTAQASIPENLSCDGNVCYIALRTPGNEIISCQTFSVTERSLTTRQILVGKGVKINAKTKDITFQDAKGNRLIVAKGASVFTKKNILIPNAKLRIPKKLAKRELTEHSLTTRQVLVRKGAKITAKRTIALTDSKGKRVILGKGASVFANKNLVLANTKRIAKRELTERNHYGQYIQLNLSHFPS
ncbi:hypothetical protein DFS34DRAFT_694910, partial [Phlyctochytrium arcticum]